MKPETAAAIAKRIGMTPTGLKVGMDRQWVDNGLVAGYGDKALATYLTTGDRPLRVMEAIKPSYNIEITCDDDRWRIWIHPDKYAEAETLAAAILACAAALEEER